MGKANWKERLNLANAVTSLRLIGAIIIIFLEPLSIPFYVVYTICGLSDGIDGTIARKMGTSSDFGSKLDSVSDLVFYIVMFVKIIPALIELMPMWMWCLVAVILAIRLFSYGYVAMRYRRFAAIHTYMNKIVGALFFLLPYLLIPKCYLWLCFGLAFLAIIGSTEELLIHVTTKRYQAEIKTIFRVKK